MKKLLSLLLISSTLFACQNSKTMSAQQIRENLLKTIPELPATAQINKSINNMYEVSVGRKIFYVSNDGKYLVFGNVIDATSKENLTEKRVNELSKIDWNKLPLELAIKSVNGTGVRKLVVFSDPECPYCQLFEKELAPKLTDTTIYTFMFPLPSHVASKDETKKIWCAKDRSSTWTNWMKNKTPLPTDMSCDTSGLETIIKIATEVVQLEATPTLILENGQILAGMMAPEELQVAMDKAKPIVAAK